MTKIEKIKNVYYRSLMKFVKKNDGFGLNEFLGIAAAVIIAALVVIPGLKTFSENVLTGLNNWWSTISSKIFLTQ